MESKSERKLACASCNLAPSSLSLSLPPVYVFFCMNLQFFPARNRSDFSEAEAEQTSLLYSQFHPDAPETTVISQKTLFPGAKAEGDAGCYRR